MLTAAFEARRMRTSEMTTGEESGLLILIVLFLFNLIIHVDAREIKHLAANAENTMSIFPF